MTAHLISKRTHRVRVHILFREPHLNLRLNASRLALRTRPQIVIQKQQQQGPGDGTIITQDKIVELVREVPVDRVAYKTKV